jgi:tyrosyl-tRNA synthetase
MFSFNKSKVDTNPEKVEEILTRSVSAVLPTKDLLRKEILSGRRLRIYIGADATSSKLHLGHATNFILMEKLRQLGHEVIFLFGDFTAKIGDPTDKSAARVRLSDKEVKHNLKSWKSQISKVVSFKDSKNKPTIVYNSTWLSKLDFEDVIDLSANFTVQQMLERDMFQMRLKDQKPIYMHEFFYPLMQGYDSVVLDVDLEVGGNDQTFNMLAGRTLMTKLKNKEKFVLATTLLQNPKTGKKLMSKSEGNYIALDDEANDMFGKTMALMDELIVPMLIDCTFVAMSEIEALRASLEKQTINPRDAKLRLAREITTIYHGSEKALLAEQNFISTFQKKEGAPEDTKEVEVSVGAVLVDVVIAEGVAPSKSEWRRLLDSGAVSNVETGEKIIDPNYKVSAPITIKAGKKRFLKIAVR